MGLFDRLARIMKAEIHHKLDKMEDPVRMIEQGIRELKAELERALKAYASLKANKFQLELELQSVRKKKKIHIENAKKYLEMAEREENQAYTVKANEEAQQAERYRQMEENLKAQLEQLESNIANLKGKIEVMKRKIREYETELRSLKARSATARAMKKVNQQLAQIDTSSTVSLIEEMKKKVEEQEALAEAYGELSEEGIADLNEDEKIEVIESPEELKKKLEMLES